MATIRLFSNASDGDEQHRGDAELAPYGERQRGRLEDHRTEVAIATPTGQRGDKLTTLRPMLRSEVAA